MVSKNYSKVSVNRFGSDIHLHINLKNKETWKAIKMIRKVIFTIFVSIIIFGQNISDNRIRYSEIHLPREHNPNANGNKCTREDYRLYSLYHEKIFENLGGRYVPNFTYRQKTKGGLMKWIYMTNKDDLPSNIKSEFVMLFPKNKQQKFKFHNGRVVTANDIIYSIKYAIEKKIIDNSIFKPENVFLDKDGNLRIKFSYELVLETVVQYLGSVFVLPAPPSYPPFIVVEDLQHKGAGPFRIHEAKDEEIILNFFNDYRTNRLFDGILIKNIPLRNKMVTALRQTNQLNLILDMPYQMLGDYNPGYERQRIPRLSIGVLWVNHTNFHLGNKQYGKKFRAALSIALDRKSFLYGDLYGDGDVLNGPFPLGSNYYPGIETPIIFNNDQDRIKKVKDNFESLPGYSYNKNGDLLFKGKQVQLTLLFQQDKSLRVIEALLALKNNLANVGIDIKGPSGKKRQILETLKKDPERWDLIYWDYYPHPASVLEEIYSSRGEENFQQYLNVEVDKLYKEFNTAVAIGRKNEIGKNIYHELKEDNASIFLWSLYDWYEFNTKEIHIDAVNKIDGEAFFSEPHLWRPPDK